MSIGQACFAAYIMIQMPGCFYLPVLRGHHGNPARSDQLRCHCPSRGGGSGAGSVSLPVISAPSSCPKWDTRKLQEHGPDIYTWRVLGVESRTQLRAQPWDETVPVSPPLPLTPLKCVVQSMSLHLSKSVFSVVTRVHSLPACDDPRKALSLVLDKCQVSQFFSFISLTPP